MNCFRFGGETTRTTTTYFAEGQALNGQTAGRCL